VLYGNVDIRQVQLAFNNSERISVVLVQKGDHVQRGQVLARLTMKPSMLFSGSNSSMRNCWRQPSAKKRGEATRQQARPDSGS